MSTSKTDERIADVLNLESTCTDPLCVLTAGALVTVLLYSSSAGGMTTLLVLAKSFGIAVAAGACRPTPLLTRRGGRAQILG